MSTKFYKAEHQSRPELAADLKFCDTDMPEEWLSQIHRIDPLQNDNWLILELDANFEVLRRGISWRDIYVRGDLGQIIELFG